MPHQRTGMVGLGLLGSAIAERLLRQGRSLLGYDLSAHRRDAMAKRGVTIATSPGELFQQCDVTILSLPDQRRRRSGADAVGRQPENGNSGD
jgi:3-hydroxyisobutyrate dehydrogenase